MACNGSGNQSEAVADVPALQLSVPYAACEVLVAVAAVVGNALVVIVFRRERRLRRRTNYYIVSLAAADFLVGLLGIPFAIMGSVGLPPHLYACLFTLSLLVVLCTISIFCLVAVSVDRYWAILHPMGYSRNVRTRTAIGIIGVCWVAGSFVGFLPLFGWHRKPAHSICYFTEVMDYNYLVFLYVVTIVIPAVLLAGFYIHIYQVVLKQLRQILTINPGRGSCTSRGRGNLGGGGGTMLRVMGPVQKREVKAMQNLSIIVIFFILCWFPLYTINCVQAFCTDCIVHPTVMQLCIVLSHLNSAVNPLLYAYHLRDFRAALKSFICRGDATIEGAGGQMGGGGDGALRYMGSQLALVPAQVAAVAAAPYCARQSLGFRRPTSALNLQALEQTPPAEAAAAAATATAHTSLASIGSSVSNLQQTASESGLPSTCQVDSSPCWNRDKMSTVAEASHSEEDATYQVGTVHVAPHVNSGFVADGCGDGNDVVGTDSPRDNSENDKADSLSTEQKPTAVATKQPTDVASDCAVQSNGVLGSETTNRKRRSPLKAMSELLRTATRTRALDANSTYKRRLNGLVKRENPESGRT